jgi:hypothetical protein
MRNPAFFLCVIFPAVFIGVMSTTAIAIIGAPSCSRGYAIWGPIDPAVVQACREDCRHPDPNRRMHAAGMLGIVGRLCPTLSPLFAADLVPLVQDSNLRVRVWAAESLGDLGRGGASGVPVLIAARGTAHPYFDLILDAEIQRIRQGASMADDAKLCTRLLALGHVMPVPTECQFRPPAGD